jgi:hypothetical protein
MTLSICCRIGELTGAAKANIDLWARVWVLHETKDSKSHQNLSQRFRAAPPAGAACVIGRSGAPLSVPPDRRRRHPRPNVIRHRGGPGLIVRQSGCTTATRSQTLSPKRFPDALQTRHETGSLTRGLDLLLDSDAPPCHVTCRSRRQLLHHPAGIRTPASSIREDGALPARRPTTPSIRVHSRSDASFRAAGSVHKLPEK